ncbi:hypothetical protein CGRA01v4_06429 [Colletotrichum graminicola]|nr:hypothetical protein CGRA01v4_06429 [Colletotrichum graminicola]
MDRPIFTASFSCHESLRRCVDRYAPFDDDWASQRLIDFNMWSAASGALDDGRYSLDNKLILTKTTSTVVSDLVGLVSVFVDACSPSPSLLESASRSVEQEARTGPGISATPVISTGGAAISHDHHKASSWFRTQVKKPKRELLPEEREARDAAEDTFSSVVQVTAVAHRSLAQSSLWLADFTFKEDDDDLRDYGQKPLEQMRSPLKATAIQARLMRANLIRRHRFLYARESRSGRAQTIQSCLS